MKECLRMSFTKKKKLMVYISTLSVFSSNKYNLEDQELDLSPLPFFSSYSASKRVAEIILQKISKKFPSFPFFCIRPGKKKIFFFFTFFTFFLLFLLFFLFIFSIFYSPRDHLWWRWWFWCLQRKGFRQFVSPIHFNVGCCANNPPTKIDHDPSRFRCKIRSQFMHREDKTVIRVEIFQYLWWSRKLFVSWRCHKKFLLFFLFYPIDGPKQVENSLQEVSYFPHFPHPPFFWSFFSI